MMQKLKDWWEDVKYLLTGYYLGSEGERKE